MGITNSNKLVSTNTIDCGDSLTVSLTLAATPDIVENPTDIVLILDRSGSMEGEPLTSLKVGANTFIDIIDKATDGTQDGQIGSGSHMAVVSFASTATKDTQLITSVADLKNAVDDLSADGFTNHGDAFTKAFELFDPMSNNAKVMVMFTDGKTTAGPPPLPIAPTPADLEEIFKDLAENIAKTGATDIVIDEIINDAFMITNVEQPTRGAVGILNATTLQWKIDELGVSGNEGASLQFTVRHISEEQGDFFINKSITYSDNENNVTSFQNPIVHVSCSAEVFPEPCPEPISVDIDGCSDSVICFAGNARLESLERILQVDINIRNVCPNKRVALAVIVNELDETGEEHPRGMKTLTIPAHTKTGCSDVLVRCIKFVLPEDLDVSKAAGGCICNERNFTVRTICHYIDTDYQCCNLI